MTTLADLRGAARLRLDDVATPHGWSDAELNAWINEAIREASTRARLNPVAEDLALVAGVAEYAVPEFVFVYRARLRSTGGILTRTTRADLDDRSTFWETATGIPRAFLVEGETLTVYPTPTAADTLELRTEQYPTKLTGDTHRLESACLLDAGEVETLLEWVMYRAGQKRDVDFTLPNPEQYEANFTRYFGPRPSSRVRRGWLEAGPTSTVRIP